MLFHLRVFWPFYSAGEGMRGRKISPQLFLLVAVHGAAMTAWVMLYLAQSLLIIARRRKLPMKVGWSATAVVFAVTGCMGAVQSVRAVPKMPFWGLGYRQFFFMMLAEIALFTTFVFARVLTRKRPEMHRAMMLVATLGILAGATV